MMSNWLGTTALVVGLGGTLLASVLALRVVLVEARDSRRARLAAAVSFEQAASSKDIFDSLRADFDTVGALSLEKYASSETARASIDAFLASAKAFLGSAPDLDASAEPIVIQPREVHERDGRPPIQHESDEEIWNILARARRGMERFIRDFAEGRGLTSSSREPVARTLDRLREAGYLNERAQKQLAFFYRVASAAIHGEHVSAEQAERAVAALEMGTEPLLHRDDSSAGRRPQ